jgi:uncharacterized protein (DUF934 family)
MRSVLQRHEIVTDAWQYLEEAQAASAEPRALIIPLSELERAGSWEAFDGALGVRVGASCGVEELARYLPRLALVAFEFPNAGDGRGYSFARLLRTRHAYTGELRAIGAVKRDQVFFMLRSGFDAFEAAPGESLEALRETLGRNRSAYQPGAPGSPVPVRRFAASALR